MYVLCVQVGGLSISVSCVHVSVLCVQRAAEIEEAQNQQEIKKHLGEVVRYDNMYIQVSLLQ